MQRDQHPGRPAIGSSNFAAPVYLRQHRRPTADRYRLAASATLRRAGQGRLFPEAFIGGYPNGASFNIHLGARTPDGGQEFADCNASMVFKSKGTDR